jgi:hypothetical protein
MEAICELTLGKGGIVEALAESSLEFLARQFDVALARTHGWCVHDLLPRPGVAYSEYPRRYSRVRNSFAAGLLVTRMLAPS